MHGNSGKIPCALNQVRLIANQRSVGTFSNSKHPGANSKEQRTTGRTSVTPRSSSTADPAYLVKLYNTINGLNVTAENYEAVVQM
ncbi:hypothetical protein T11_10108, partial [Trichinella zimbabwensis]